MAALLEKELRSLARMPRFRVIFGMACVFSVVIFVPIAFNELARGKGSFLSRNFLSVATLYGLLLSSDSLLLNIFGFDRRATQIYFVAPVPLRAVIQAKNLTACLFIALQSLVVLCVAALIHISFTSFKIADALASAGVVALYFLCIGNLTSISMARPIDPTQTLKKQAGGKTQFWFLLCSLGMSTLVGFALLARWAFASEWALLAVLAFEGVVGFIAYHLAIQSAVHNASERREQLIDALSKGASPIGLGGS